MQVLQNRQFALIAVCALLGLLVILKPAQVPPVWFDEGWTLSVARNWVELGHYGQLNRGEPEPVPASLLNIGLPAVAPVALSFRLFGVGVWQGRLPGILFTLGAIGALCFLAYRLFDGSVAVGTLIATLLFSVHPELHPVFVGRQAIGEMPALFYLLVGFSLFSFAWQRPVFFVPLAALFWAFSLRTKPQVLPFLVAALLVPLILAVWKRCSRTAKILASGSLGLLVITGLFAGAESVLLSSPLFSAASGNDPYAVVRDAGNLRSYVFVLDPSVRLSAIRTVLVLSMPSVLGLGYAAWKSLMCPNGLGLDTYEETGRLSLWTLAASWLAWYAFLSIGLRRYLFPSVFIGSVFLAVLMQDTAGGFSMPRLLKRGVEVLKHRRLSVPGMGILLTAIVMPAAFLLTSARLSYSYYFAADDSLPHVVEFLNRHGAPDGLIETCESELFFLLERSYHHPPESVFHQLNRRTLLRSDNAIEYDPLATDPDYLVVGSMSRMWRLYDAVLASGAFSLSRTYGHYEIYERVR